MDLEKIQKLREKYKRQLKLLDDLERSLTRESLRNEFGYCKEFKTIYHHRNKNFRVHFFELDSSFRLTLHLCEFIIDKHLFGEKKARKLNYPIIKKDKEDLEKIKLIKVEEVKI